MMILPEIEETVQSQKFHHRNGTKGAKKTKEEESNSGVIY
jgi:hypothetical protein